MSAAPRRRSLPLSFAEMLLIGCIPIFVAAPLIAGPYWVRLLTEIFMYVVVTQGLNLIVGLAGYHAFGNAAFFGIGAYGTGVLMTIGVPFAPALAGGVLICAIVAAVLGWPILRLRGHYFAVATIALNLALIDLVPNVGGVTGGAAGLALPLSLLSPQALDLVLYFAMLAAAIAATGLFSLVLRTRLGFALRAIRDSEPAAGVVGINTARAKIVAWSLSAASTGLAGGIWAYWITFIEPSSAFDPTIGLRGYLMLIMGGMGTVGGPVFGAFLLQLLTTGVWSSLLTGHNLVLGFLIVLICMAAPRGLPSALMGLTLRFRRSHAHARR